MLLGSKIFCLIMTAGLVGAALISPAGAGSSMLIQARVERVSVKNPTSPAMAVQILEAPTPFSTMQRIILTVPFRSGKRGGIDWSVAANRSKAFVLGLAAGDVILAEIGAEPPPSRRPRVPPRSTAAADQARSAGKDRSFRVTKIQLVAAASEMIFPGSEKIQEQSLIDTFLVPPRVPIVVLLGGKETARTLDSVVEPGLPEDRNAAGSEASVGQIRRLQDKVLADIPQGAFELDRRLENAPLLSGRATFAGLKALAAHPLVKAIETDRALQPHQPSTRDGGSGDRKGLAIPETAFGAPNGFFGTATEG